MFLAVCDRAAAQVPLWRELGRASPATRFLFVAGHAGCGVNPLRPFANAAPPGWRVFGLLLPGRETRLREPPEWELSACSSAAAASAAETLTSGAAEEAVAVGQCLGAWFLAQMLDDRNSRQHARFTELVAISQGPPGTMDEQDKVSRLSSEEFWDVLVRQVRVQPEIAEHPEMRALLEPALRADLAVAEGPVVLPMLDVPITAVGGLQDPYPEDLNLEDWQSYTLADASTRWVPGGHFPLQESPDATMAAVLRRATR